MQLRNHNPANDKPHWSHEEMSQAVWFWIFWSIFVFLSSIVILAILTDWPQFLHPTTGYGR